MTIKTEYSPKPIPNRDFDWEAWDDSRGAEAATGYGPTEADAIARLKELLESKYGE